MVLVNAMITRFLSLLAEEHDQVCRDEASRCLKFIALRKTVSKPLYF
jgi:hypothetical protein